ncbi:MAG: hydroxymethylbilane synthase [Proteobacteria bacterium]|nr:hydroxymethylbilane synthase [Pseudomonadota bacterium]
MDAATMQTDRLAALAPHGGAPVVTPGSVPRHHPRLPLRVGTRASPLALQQTRSFLKVLARVCPVLHQMDVFQEHVIRTTGDAVQDRRLAEIGGKGLFAKEIHEALMDGRIDLAVHSLKDLETALPPGIVLACTLPREDVRDALILSDGCEDLDEADPLAILPHGAIVGTCSVRRQAQLLHARPDLNITMMRGNVHSRLDKIRHGDCAASLLAMAGLRRLGLEAEATIALSPETMLPAACQGIVGITAREDATELRDLLKIVEDRAARVAATAERSLLGTLDGSCSTPIGAFGQLLPDNRLRLSGLLASTDGTFLRRGEIEGGCADAARMGAELGASLKAGAPASVFA